MVSEAVREAVEEVVRWRERAAAAEAKRDADELEVARLEASAGADILDDDDPDAGDRLAARIGALRASVELQGRVAAEAAARAVAASARALRAQGDDTAPALDAAVAELDTFNAKTERLAAALAKHTGGKVRVVLPDEEVLEAIRDGGRIGETFEYDLSPAQQLEALIEDQRVRVDAAYGLAAVVAGAKSAAELRDSFVGAGRTVRWDHLPSLVQDGTIPVDGLEWVAPAAPVAPVE